jgi:hypothetical protein
MPTTRAPMLFALALAACGGPSPAPTPAPTPAAAPVSAPAPAAPPSIAAPAAPAATAEIDGCALTLDALRLTLKAPPSRVGPVGDCVVTGDGAPMAGKRPDEAARAALAGWDHLLDQEADGPTGTRSVYRKGDQTCQLTFSWPEAGPAAAPWTALVECKRG